MVIPLVSLKNKDSEELNRLILDMNVPHLSNEEASKIKENILDFLNSFRNDIYVVEEVDYVDKVYRDSYYDYYSTKLRAYNRNCLRLSFFDSLVDQNFSLDNIDNIKDNYLGFLVLRPQQKCIGRNVINPKALIKNDGISIKICNVDILSSCYGIKLTAKGFPHASQDSETMTCAQTTIWMLMEYFGNKYNQYKTTVSSEIEKILTPFVYERQLPSRGLTYNQVSVALRELGFGTKIYNYQNNSYEIFACYIESGIPLAVALVDDDSKSGHAVVCVGRNDVNKEEVKKHLQHIQSGVDLYCWNEAVAQSLFVFNDDNFSCYTTDNLSEPCKRYKTKKASYLAKMKIKQFIAPLYNKVYMEANMAIKLSKEIVAKKIPDCNECVIRTLLTSSRTFREHLTQIKSFTDDQRKALLQIPMPKFIWLTEVSTLDQFYKDKVNSILLLDATGSPRSDLQNIVLLLANGKYYESEQNQWWPTKYSKEFEAFSGNLR